jgi:hypothetical protein
LPAINPILVTLFQMRLTFATTSVRTSTKLAIAPGRCTWGVLGGSWALAPVGGLRVRSAFADDTMLACLAVSSVTAGLRVRSPRPRPRQHLDAVRQPA